MLTMALMNEGLFICQMAADKSGPDVMKLPPHSINLDCRHRQSCTFLTDLPSSRPSQCNSSRASLWGVAPAHRSVDGTRRTPCGRGNLCRQESCSKRWNGCFGTEPALFFEVSALLAHLACRLEAHRAAWSHAAALGAEPHPPAFLRAPLESHILLL